MLADIRSWSIIAIYTKNTKCSGPLFVQTPVLSTMIKMFGDKWIFQIIKAHTIAPLKYSIKSYICTQNTLIEQWFQFQDMDEQGLDKRGSTAVGSFAYIVGVRCFWRILLCTTKLQGGNNQHLIPNIKYNTDRLCHN